MPTGVFEKLKGQTRVCVLETCQREFEPRQPNQLACCPSHANMAKLRNRLTRELGARITKIEERVAKLEKRRRN